MSYFLWPCWRHLFINMSIIRSFFVVSFTNLRKTKEDVKFQFLKEQKMQQSFVDGSQTALARVFLRSNYFIFSQFYTDSQKIEARVLEMNLFFVPEIFVLAAEEEGFVRWNLWFLDIEFSQHISFVIRFWYARGVQFSPESVGQFSIISKYTRSNR